MYEHTFDSLIEAIRLRTLQNTAGNFHVQIQHFYHFLTIRSAMVGRPTDFATERFRAHFCLMSSLPHTRSKFLPLSFLPLTSPHVVPLFVVQHTM